MTKEIHSCSYYCDRPECIKAQRDELREMFCRPANTARNTEQALKVMPEAVAKATRGGFRNWWATTLQALPAADRLEPGEHLLYADKPDAAARIAELEAMYAGQCACADEWADKYRAEVERKADATLLARVAEAEQNAATVRRIVELEHELELSKDTERSTGNALAEFMQMNDTLRADLTRLQGQREDLTRERNFLLNNAHSMQEQLAAKQAEWDSMADFIRSDAVAISFQSLAQYRNAMLMMMQDTGGKALATPPETGG